MVWFLHRSIARPPMTKRDIVRRVTQDSDVNPALAAKVVQRVLDSIVETLATDGGIELRDFGVFDVVTSKERIARNPRTGERVVVPPKARVRFAAGKEMAAKINGSPQTHPVEKPAQA